MQEEQKKVDPRVIEILNKFLQEEYQSIINYLYRFFHSKDINHKDVMFDIAIESMVHMGKLGEAIAELGGMPDIRADLSRKDRKTMQESLEEDIKFEQETGGDYKKALGHIEDEGVKKLFEFIESQEEYHKHMLMELFKKMRRLTVGDLRRKE
jgi:bacterioferritin